MRSFLLTVLFVAGTLSSVPIDASAADLTVRLTDSRGGPLEDAVLTAERIDGAPVEIRRDQKAVMDQKNQQFSPNVLAIQVGTSVSFPNSDAIRHQVYSFAPAKRFQLPLYSGTTARPVRFEKPGIVTLGCSIHDSMIGYIYVVETPHFATSKGGLVSLTLPPGKYQISAWHPRSRKPAIPQNLAVNAKTAPQNLAFRLDVEAPAAPAPASPLEQKFKKFKNGGA